MLCTRIYCIDGRIKVSIVINTHLYKGGSEGPKRAICQTEISCVPKEFARWVSKADIIIYAVIFGTRGNLVKD